MNPLPDRAHLLADVLSEGEPPAFRASLLGETLRLARRRRHARRARRAATSALAFAILGIFAWRFAPSASAPANYQLVRTRPVSAMMLVATRPFATEQLVHSLASVTTVRTQLDRGALRTIDDKELLALAAPRPAALIRIGPHAQTLIFADIDERDASP